MTEGGRILRLRIFDAPLRMTRECTYFLLSFRATLTLSLPKGRGVEESVRFGELRILRLRCAPLRMTEVGESAEGRLMGEI